jgi:5-methylcytosine-specific restriction endonuclease McrA
VDLKIDKADEAFSQYIRLRDGECVRCWSKVRYNSKGLPVSHQASHYYGRGKESTRFDPENVDTLCHGCHQYWGSTDREDYRAFKIKQLGQKRFDALLIQSNTTQKKDRKMQYLKFKNAVEMFLKMPDSH